MGSIKHFDLQKFIDEFHLENFIETGLGWGDGLNLAAGFSFKNLFSLEISEKVIAEYYSKYQKVEKIKIIPGKSTDTLTEILPDLTNSFIFLDSHFPNYDVFGGDINKEKDNKIKYPLFSELEIIKKLRADVGCRDVILIDDVMFYSNDIFPDSHLKKHFHILPPEEGNCLDKITGFFKETHDSKIIREFSGYALFTPKNK